MTGREATARLDVEILTAFSVPPARLGPPPPACFSCTRAWRGFDGDNRSVCCGQSRTRLMEQQRQGVTR